MDAFTHGLASYSITRALFPRASRATMIAAVLAGSAANLDYISVGVGPSAFLNWYCTATHSVLGALVITTIFALAVALAMRGRPMPDGFRTVLLALLATEIGAKSKAPRGRIGAIIALLVVFAYIGARTALHGNAVATMEARTYRGELPRRVAAFAESDSPFHWRGLVETERAFYDFDLSVAPGSSFNPDAGVVSYKPQSSAPLDAARTTESVRSFLEAAKFPKASVEQTKTGYRVQLRDLAEQREAHSGPHVIAIIETDANAKVLSDELAWDNQR